MPRNLLSFCLLFVMLVLFGCERPGTGGRATVHIHVFDDTRIMPYAMVQVRYGATGFPGSNVQYSDSILSDYSGQATFEKLRKGNYYFYVTAIDSSTQTFEFIEGGAQVDVDNRDGERHVVIDLSEEDPF